MELLLNLAWLLLAVPAYWLWRRAGNTGARREFGARQVLLALACVLVLLFPVISATDDLHAMRAEVEESSATKRSIRQASSDRVSVWNIRLLTPMVVEDFRGYAPGTELADLSLDSDCILSSAPVILRAGRAPPFHPLA